MKVILAKTYGFCPGVIRAIKMAQGQKLKTDKERLFVLKELVHNPKVVSDLGIPSVRNLKEVPNESTVIFSAHGIPPHIYNQAKEKKLKIIDATCPLVLRVHQLVKKFVNQGYQIIYIGDKKHDEVLGVLGEAPLKIKLVTNLNEAKKLKIKNSEKLVILTQTTLSIFDTQEIVDVLKKKFPKALVFNTICQATTQRQKAVIELAKKAEVIIVVGGKNSANSQRLVEVAKKYGKPSYLITYPEELNPLWFKGKTVVGLTAGASTPREELDKVKEKIETL